MNVFDVIVVLAFVAVAVVGAELVRRTCRRQLASIDDRKPTAPVASAPATTIGTGEIE